MKPSAPILSMIEEGLALERSGDIAAALQHASQALEMANTSGDEPARAAALVAVARIRFCLGQYQAAKSLAEEALALAPAESPTRAEALLRLGSCVGVIDSPAQAEVFFRRAADSAREIGHHLIHMRALHNLAAGVYISRGQFDLALAADEESYRIASAQNLHEHIHFPLITIAWNYLTTGQCHRARAVLEELEQVALPDSNAQGYHYCLTATLAQDEGDLQTALRSYTQAYSIAEAIGDSWLSIAARLGVSRCHRVSGNAYAAREWADDALTLVAHVGYPLMQGQALIERSRAAWLIGDLAGAASDLSEAIQILENLKAAYELARARLLLAALLHHQKHDDAVAIWKEAARDIVAGGYTFLLERERALAFPLVAAHLNSPDPTLAQACAMLVKHLQRIPPAPLRVVTLGRFEVWQGSRSVERRALRQRRAGDLLALLLLAPDHTLSFDQVTEALCPERDPGAAQVFFHHATSSLRRALEPDLPEKFLSRYLEVEEGRIALYLPPDSWTDFGAFETHCRQGDWEEALTLYDGELLPEYLYADWTIAPRQRLAFLHQQALLAAARARLAEDRFAEALDACHRVLALEPWQEQAVLMGMQACRELNDRAGALRLYRNLEKVLRKDLDTAPSDELQAFYHSLIR